MLLTSIPQLRESSNWLQTKRKQVLNYLDSLPSTTINKIYSNQSYD